MKHFTPKKVRTTTFILLGAGALAALCGTVGRENTFLILAGLILMVFSMILYFIFYRCPHCGKYLGRNTGSFCPNCGKTVNDTGE